MDIYKTIASVKPAKPKRLAIASAHDDIVLKAAVYAYKTGLAIPILCGDRSKTSKTASVNAIDISPFEIIHTADDNHSALAAVELVRRGKADILMKGDLQTSVLLKALLDKETGLRERPLLSHVGIIHSPVLKRMFILTDAAMVPSPDLADKVELIANACQVACSLGIKHPKVAVITALEFVNPKMQATVDAAALTVMNRRGQITGCTVDGPLSFDIAVSEDRAKRKHADSPVAGKADILLFHTIEAANSTSKALTLAGGCLSAGLIMGATAPVAVTSRADSFESRLYSIVCAVRIADSPKEAGCDEYEK